MYKKINFFLKIVYKKVVFKVHEYQIIFTDYIIIDITNTIRKNHRVKIIFSSNSARIGIKIYKLKESRSIGTFYYYSKK